MVRAADLPCQVRERGDARERGAGTGWISATGWTEPVCQRPWWYLSAAAPSFQLSTAYFHSSPVGPLLSPLWGWENNYKMKVMPVHQGKSSLSQHQEVAGCESMGLDTGYLVSSVALEGDVGHLAQLPGKNMLS